MTIVRLTLCPSEFTPNSRSKDCWRVYHLTVDDQVLDVKLIVSGFKTEYNFNNKPLMVYVDSGNVTINFWVIL